MITTLREEKKCTVRDVTNLIFFEKPEMSVEEILEEVRSKITNLRRLEYLLNSDRFRVHYKGQNDFDDEIDSFIQTCNLEAIESWIRCQELKNLDLMTALDLRQLARRKGIKDYNSLRRHELISKIQERAARVQNDE